MVRRATPRQVAQSGISQQPVEGLPPSPHGLGDNLSKAQLNRSVRAPSDASASDSLAPPTMGGGAKGTLRPSRSRANRNDLLGIFAGAPSQISPTGEPWVVMPGRTSPLGTSVPSTSRIRSVSSQQFTDRSIRSPRDALNQRKRLSAIVDAVIDTSAEDIENDDNVISGHYDSPIRERTLRPRGLSDSSIRSTFQSHANPGEGLISPPISSNVAARATAHGSVVGRQPGMLESFSRKFYSFRSADARTTTETKAASPPRPIPAKASSSRPGAISPTTTSSSMTGPSTIFGYFASSLAGAVPESMTTVDGGEEEEEFTGGSSMRYPALVSRSLSRGPGQGKGNYR